MLRASAHRNDMGMEGEDVSVSQPKAIHHSDAAISGHQKRLGLRVVFDFAGTQPAEFQWHRANSSEGKKKKKEGKEATCPFSSLSGALQREFQEHYTNLRPAANQVFCPRNSRSNVTLTQLETP